MPSFKYVVSSLLKGIALALLLQLIRFGVILPSMKVNSTISHLRAERGSENGSAVVPTHSTAEDKEDAKARDADGCYHVFLDVGANVGVHGRFLFEPSQYPHANVAHDIFNRAFGKPDTRDNRDLCAFEIEPNPAHQEVLRQKAEAYAAMGWRYHVIGKGASDQDGSMTFNRMNDTAKNEWGFGIGRESISIGTVAVPVFRLATWLDEHVYKRRIPDKPFGTYDGGGGPKVVMKLDIEGSELIVLPDLLLSGAMCRNLDVIFGEFHSFVAPIAFPGQRVSFKERGDVGKFRDALLQVIPSSRNCDTRFDWVDDESYLHDDVPLPSPGEDGGNAR